MRRRRLLIGAAAWPAAATVAQVPDWSLRARQRLAGTDPEARRALLHEGERLLAERDAAAAEAAFDRAALLLHAADTEIALVRAYMQQGQYRRALAFCAHAAGVHRDVVAAAALYVWLLDAGGQPAVARLRLAEADGLYPAEPLLAALREQLEGAAPRAQGLLRELPARLAPYAPAAPERARVAGAAVLLPDGHAALAPSTLMGPHRSAWLRNGMGDSSWATVTASGQGFEVLSLQTPLPAVPEAAPAARDPFAGRPGFAAGHAARADADSDWPRLRMGFLGALARDGRRRRMDLAPPGAAVGALLLDEGGCFAGLGLGPEGWLPASQLRETVPLAADAQAPRPLAPDAAYETALRLSLQLLLPA